MWSGRSQHPANMYAQHTAGSVAHRDPTRDMSWFSRFVHLVWWILSDAHIFIAWELERALSIVSSVLFFFCGGSRRSRVAEAGRTAVVIMSAGEGAPHVRTAIKSCADSNMQHRCWTHALTQIRRSRIQCFCLSVAWCVIPPSWIDV